MGGVKDVVVTRLDALNRCSESELLNITPDGSFALAWSMRRRLQMRVPASSTQ